MQKKNDSEAAMLSCDTFSLTKSYYEGRENLLAKNSDRPLGEAQPLFFAPAADYEKGALLSCTHLTLPQVPHSYAVLGSRPFWIWGFEMGANEKGLFIGNEAQGSRCPAEGEEGLLGMDLLRLGLERSANARGAISVIGSLLARYGQNANANLRYDRRYENSFLLADPEEVWIMETAGRQWAARQVKDWAPISNCYSIEEDYDLSSPEMESYARDRRWLSPGEPMNFAKAYTLPASRQNHSVPRFRRMLDLISSHKAPLTEGDVKAIFRDHYEGTLLAPRYGAFYANFVTLCMHAQDENSAQTAASMIFTRDSVLGLKFRYAPSLPCCSVYLPLYWTETLPELLTKGSGKFSTDSLWWCVERLAMAVSVDEARFGPQVREKLKALECEIEKDTAAAEDSAKRQMAEGKEKEALTLLSSLTEKSAEKLQALALRLADAITEKIREEGGLYGQRKEFLESYCKWADMPL